MRLQEVLKERETEIMTLEVSLRQSQAGLGKAEALTSPPEDQDVVLNNIGLSPKTLNHFDHIKQSMVNGNGNIANSDHGSSHSESDESLERLNELMLYVGKCLFSTAVILTNDIPDLWHKRSLNTGRSWMISTPSWHKQSGSLMNSLHYQETRYAYHDGGFRVTCLRSGRP